MNCFKGLDKLFPSVYVYETQFIIFLTNVLKSFEDSNYLIYILCIIFLDTPKKFLLFFNEVKQSIVVKQIVLQKKCLPSYFNYMCYKNNEECKSYILRTVKCKKLV